MFKRRENHGPIRRLREAVWPSMGWLRAADYYRHRIFRTGDSAYRVTAGLASGVAVSFSPILGTHFVQGLLLAWVVRGNYVASFVGTAFGNPWTFPLIFWGAYHVGVAVFGLFGMADFVELPDELTLSFLMKNPWTLFAPLLLGGYICAAVSWPLSYLLLYFPVRAITNAYAARRARARERKRPGAAP